MKISKIGKYAPTPPMGWNSWDCFGVNVTEDEVRANAEFMAKYLKAFGWQYVVVDLGWYAPSATKDNYKNPKIEMLIDEYGRLIPDVNRFPSAADGKGFKPLADYIHSLGLKFGIHMMRGIPWIAAEQNTPILGSTERAADVAVPEDMCLWYNSMYGINMTRDGGRAYYDSLVELYAEWDVDFIKADDMNSWDGDGLIAPYHTDEIAGLAESVKKSKRDMLISLSPGAALVSNAQHLRDHANMWRISCDFWDDWDALKRQFERCARWAPYVVPGHWPDADMLPFGKIGIRGEVGETRSTFFTNNELYTLVTLWAIFRSPLMFGGHLPECDEFSISLLTNNEVLAVNQNSENNRQLYRDEEKVVWIADVPGENAKYLALFNIGEQESHFTVLYKDIDMPEKSAVRNLWKKQDHECSEAGFNMTIPSHAAALFKIY